MVVHRRILDAIIRHRIDLQRHARHEASIVVGLIAKEDVSLIDLLKQRFPNLKPSDIKASRAKALIAALKETRNGSWSALHARLRDDLLELAKIEATALGRIAETALRAPLVFNPVRASIMRGAVLREPFAGGVNATRTLSQWVGKLVVDDRQRLVAAVQLGIKRMETVDQMARRLVGTRALGFKDGVLAISRRQAEVAVRTAVVHVANRAQVEWATANKDVVSGLEWVSILDNRTCPVCSDLDGEVTADVPPKHPGCRCDLVPVLDLDRMAGRLPDRMEDAA